MKELLIKIIKKVLFRTKITYVDAKVSFLSQNNMLENRTALVTGGTSGIGFEIAIAFINAGAKVVITGRDENRLREACEKINEKTKKKDSVIGIVLDNTKIKSFDSVFADILEELKDRHIDILVNNAGVLGCSFNDGIETEFDAVIDTNLKGVFFLSQIVARYMKRNEIRGNILNIASSSSLRPGVSAYTLSKWGIRSLTLGMAKSLIPYDIVVNGLAPGQTATPMLLKDQESKNLWCPFTPAGRYALPEEIANMATILVSDMSRMIVGDIVYMTGGSGVIANDDMNYNFD